jgi:hypothetical protein
MVISSLVLFDQQSSLPNVKFLLTFQDLNTLTVLMVRFSLFFSSFIHELLLYMFSLTHTSFQYFFFFFFFFSFQVHLFKKTVPNNNLSSK